eukprot:SAG31_NODE_6977_length_1828_cov_5.271833_2_plen_226_part_00
MPGFCSVLPTCDSKNKSLSPGWPGAATSDQQLKRAGLGGQPTRMSRILQAQCPEALCCSGRRPGLQASNQQAAVSSAEEGLNAAPRNTPSDIFPRVPTVCILSQHTQSSTNKRQNWSEKSKTAKQQPHSSSYAKGRAHLSPEVAWAWQGRPSAKHCASAPVVFADGSLAVSFGPLGRWIVDSYTTSATTTMSRGETLVNSGPKPRACARHKSVKLCTYRYEHQPW